MSLQEIVDLIACLAGLVAILDYFGIKPKRKAEGGSMSLSRKWKLVIMLALVASSLGLSLYSFYRSRHPKIVEKIIEKPVEKIVEKPVDRIVEKTLPCPKAKITTPKKAENGDPPSMKQDCGGGNCAQSSGQQGGITAGQVNIGARQWDQQFNGELQKEMIADLSTVHGRFRVIWYANDPDAMKLAGGFIYTFRQAGWQESPIPNYAGSLCYPSDQWDCHGIELNVHVDSSPLSQEVARAFSRLKTTHVFLHETLIDDDLIEVFVAKP
jgi:hypothetical protein